MGDDLSIRVKRKMGIITHKDKVDTRSICKGSTWDLYCFPPSKMSTTDLSKNWSTTTSLVSKPTANLQLKTPTESQSPWAYLLLLLPFFTVFVGGLIWPTDDSESADNPLRPAGWMFFLAWSIITLAYGLVWNQIYIEHSGRYFLHFIFALPIILSLLWLIIFNGAGLVVEAAWVLYALQASVIAVTALTAGLSDIPEWVLFLMIFLGWGMLATDLNVQQAIDTSV